MGLERTVIDRINKVYGFVLATTATVDADALLGLLSKIGKVAGAVAPVVLVASFAIDIAVIGRVAVDALLADAKDYVSHLGNIHPNPAQLEAASLKLNASIVQNRNGIEALLDVQSWMTLFDPGRHSQIWGLMQHHLFLLPGAARSPVRAVLMNKSNQFDHRLMVPLA